MGRVMALDVGSKRIGVAVSDELGILASPHGSIMRESLTRDVGSIIALVRELGVERIVVGHPVGDSGRATRQTVYSERFADRLARDAPVPVALWDEGHTSWAAREIVGHAPATRRSGRVDAVAATLILQSYLDERPDTPSGAASLDAEGEPS